MKADRENIIGLIADTCREGARQSKACEIIGITPKTLQRWMAPDKENRAA